MNSLETAKKLQHPFLKEESFEEGFFHSEGTYIHPTAIIGENVHLGLNVKVGPYCTIVGNVTIDANTRIHGYVSIGMPAQDVGTKQSLGSVVVGKNCEIREFVTISAPKIAGNATTIGDNCYIMNFCHIAHDVTIEHNVILINNVNLGGHVYIEHHCMLMANTGFHQFCRVGAYSSLAPFSGMRQDLPPYCMFNGRPGAFAGLNIVALRRNNFSAEERNAIKHITKLFFQDKLTLEQIKEEIAHDTNLHQSQCVQHFISFIENSKRGISRKTILDIHETE